MEQQTPSTTVWTIKVFAIMESKIATTDDTVSEYWYREASDEHFSPISWHATSWNNWKVAEAEIARVRKLAAEKFDSKYWQVLVSIAATGADDVTTTPK